MPESVGVLLKGYLQEERVAFFRQGSGENTSCDYSLKKDSLPGYLESKFTRLRDRCSKVRVSERIRNAGKWAFGGEKNPVTFLNTSRGTSVHLSASAIGFISRCDDDF